MSEEFVPGQQVCRLACRHMYHAVCWENLTASMTRQGQLSCPNCRGPGRMISVWPYLDPMLVTQADPQNPGMQLPNQLDSASDSLPEPDNGGPEADSAGVDHQTGHFFSEDTLTTREEASASAYPIRTQLADGRPSLIIDPGSVGNLC